MIARNAHLPDDLLDSDLSLELSDEEWARLRAVQDDWRPAIEQKRNCYRTPDVATEATPLLIDRGTGDFAIKTKLPRNQRT